MKRIDHIRQKIDAAKHEINSPVTDLLIDILEELCDELESIAITGSRESSASGAARDSG